MRINLHLLCWFKKNQIKGLLKENSFREHILYLVASRTCHKDFAPKLKDLVFTDFRQYKQRQRQCSK